MIPGPYLLYIGNATEPLSAKTARGIAVWRPELALGQYRRGSDTVDLGLLDLSYKEAVRRGARTLVLGVANSGGVMSDAMAEDVVDALRAGLHVASGLHQRLRDHPAVRAEADARELQLFDVRRPPDGLPVGDGYRRAGRRLLTVGTDCAVGKMYTTLAIEREMRSRGLAADFRATGQTGILIAGSGMPVDAVVADFISGAVEVLSPVRGDGGWDLIEGQGSLFHPGFAGVTMGLIHGAQPDALVLCHQVGREHVRHVPGRALPDLKTCLDRNLEAARLTNPDVAAVGVALNTSSCAPDAARRALAEAEDRLGLPAQDPIADGVGRIVDGLLRSFSA